MVKSSFDRAFRVSNAAARLLGRPAFPSLGSGGYCYEGHRRACATPEIAGPRPSRGRAPQHHPDPRQRADPRRKRQTIVEGDRPRSRGDGNARCGNRNRRFDHGAGAHVLRHRAQIARRRPDRAGRRWRPLGAGDPRRPLPLHAADLAGKRFPDLAAGDMTHSFTLAAADVKRLIDRTQFAISTEETRYYLNGIYLHSAGSAKAVTLRGVATDGHRLAQIDLPLPKGATGMPGVIVPRKTVGEVQRLIEDNEAEVLIELSQGKIRFTLGNVVLTSKLIDGTFPDYGRVIPQNNDKELIVDKKDFEAAVDRVP